MRADELFLLFTRPLDEGRFRYAVTGSVAGSAYGEPRMTNDIDIVVDLAAADAARVEALFPLSDFYCPPVEVIAVEARRALRGHFNVIHHDSGFKADLYPKGDDPLQTWALDGAQRLELSAGSMLVAPPEYVIVKKLEWHREGGSQKHLDDIANILAAQPALDLAIIERHVARLGLSTSWAAARQQRSS